MKRSNVNDFIVIITKRLFQERPAKENNKKHDKAMQDMYIYHLLCMIRENKMRLLH